LSLLERFFFVTPSLDGTKKPLFNCGDGLDQPMGNSSRIGFQDGGDVVRCHEWMKRP
jgi:hypothetical protein